MNEKMAAADCEQCDELVYMWNHVEIITYSVKSEMTVISLFCYPWFHLS